MMDDTITDENQSKAPVDEMNGLKLNDGSIQDESQRSELKILKDRLQSLKKEHRVDAKKRRLELKEQLDVLRDQIKQLSKDKGTRGELIDADTGLKSKRIGRGARIGKKSSKMSDKIKNRQCGGGLKEIRKASRSIKLDMKENNWPTEFTHLVIDFESLCASNFLMKRLSKSEDGLRAVCQILANLIAHFHESMKSNSTLTTIQVLLNTSESASMVNSLLKQNSSTLTNDDIQVMSTESSQSGVEDMLRNVIDELKRDEKVDSTLIVTNNKTIFRYSIENKISCIQSKPIIHFMITKTHPETDKNFKFGAWMNAECSKLGVDELIPRRACPHQEVEL